MAEGTRPVTRSKKQKAEKTDEEIDQESKKTYVSV